MDRISTPAPISARVPAPGGRAAARPTDALGRLPSRGRSRIAPLEPTKSPPGSCAASARPAAAGANVLPMYAAAMMQHVIELPPKRHGRRSHERIALGIPALYVSSCCRIPARSLVFRDGFARSPFGQQAREIERAYTYRSESGLGHEIKTSQRPTPFRRRIRYRIGGCIGE